MATGRVVKVAVLGAGPSGIYTADALIKQQGLEVEIDVFDRLPTPYGLVRYGVAPDHPNIKSVVRALQRVLECPQVRFFGCVEFGTDITREELISRYDAVVYAIGASVDRPLGVPGESLPGSHPATEFVAWYSGHPDARLPMRLDQIESVAIIGVGNVALDVARMLAKTHEDLAQTDVPGNVMDVLRTSRVRDIHLIGRRGAQFAKFTSKELRELGDLVNATVHVVSDEVAVEPADEHERSVATNLRILGEWAATPEKPTKPRRIWLRFGLRPTELIGSDRLQTLRCERTRTEADGAVVGTGEYEDFSVQCVLRAVGYRSLPLPGVPFDDDRGVVNNVGGRVVGKDGDVIAGEYVAGWLKRGPTGVIGTNKSDANETVRALVEDLAAEGAARCPDFRIDDFLLSRGIEAVDYRGWLRIDSEERARGSAERRERIKIPDWDTLRRTAAGD